jgi:hypothetical protein
VGTLVRQARRRILGNELLAQGANAASVALGMFILLLLLGTEILAWPVALAIPLLASAFGLFRVRTRLPAPYAVAQIVDRRLDLADSLSTALFFSEVEPGAPVTEEVRRAQFESAGRLAQTVDVRSAVPYTLPRGMYVMAALLVIAGSLFAVRYGLSRKLDLKQPIANFLPESLAGGKTVHQANNQRRNPKQVPETPDDGNGASDQDQKGPGQQDPNQEMQTAGEPESKSDAKTDSKSAPGQKSSEQGDSQMASDDQDSQSDAKGGKEGDENQSGQQGDSKAGQSEKQQNGKHQDSANNDENSSLMSKMKDAFQNLMSKVKPQQNQQGAPQQGSQEQNSRQGKPQQGQKGQNNKDGQQQTGNQQGDAQEGEDGQEAKNNENAQQGKGQGKSDSQQSSKQPGSGIGSQDGDKAIKNAEQLAAMGKISEILGKRSATISGEATVEVQSTSQQLHTPYAQKGAQHTQGGAEISRDEVPVSLQPYVQQYFEQLRKQAPAAAAPASGQAPPAGIKK